MTPAVGVVPVGRTWRALIVILHGPLFVPVIPIWMLDERVDGLREIPEHVPSWTFALPGWNSNPKGAETTMVPPLNSPFAASS